MKADFYIKTDFGLVPKFESEWYNKLKTGDVVEAKIVKPRNVKFHNKFWGLMHVVFENQDIYNDIEFMREELTKAAGFFDLYVNHKGNVCYMAKSISFSSMDEEEFEVFYQAIMDKCCEVWGYDPELLEHEID